MYKHFVKDNSDGSKTETLIYRKPGVFVRYSETTFEDDEEPEYKTPANYEDIKEIFDKLNNKKEKKEDISDRIIIKKVDKKAKKEDKQDDEDYDKLCEALCDSLGISKDEYEDKIRDRVEEIRNIADKYIDEDFDKISKALPDMVLDEGFIEGLVDYIVKSYHKKNEE